MRRLNVLYAGPVLAGRSTSLGSLSGTLPSEGVVYMPPRRLHGQEVHLSSGETILLDAMVPHTGNFAFASLEAATRTDVDWIRELALAVIAFLPTIDGVVFVADSTPFHHHANLRSLHQILGELRAAGLDVDRLPFVFQCNKRDCLDALPLAQVTAPLATARCAHVESVARAGHGVTRALDSLVNLLDGGFPGTTTSRPMLLSEADEHRPREPHRLFEDATMNLTSDGEVRATLHVSTREPELALIHRANDRRSSIPLASVPRLTPGRYAIDVVERVVSLREPGGWRIVSGSVVAARIRLRDATAVSHQPMAHVERFKSEFVTIGLQLAVGGTKPGNIADEACMQARVHGIAVVAWQGSRFELASPGEMAVISPYIAGHAWLGRDGAGRIVEVSLHGEEGTEVLRRLAQEGPA